MQKELPTPMAEKHVGGGRRQWIRHPCDLAASCRQLGVATDVVPWRGTVVDLGAGGFSLLTTRLVEPGVFLSVELQAKPPELTYRTLIQVIRSNKTADGRELGCAFVSPLAESKLRQLPFPLLGSRETDKSAISTLSQPADCVCRNEGNIKNGLNR